MMESLKQPRAFGLIEVLIALVILMFLVYRLTSLHRRPSGSTDSSLRTYLQSDLEQEGAVHLTALGITHLSGTNGKGSFEYLAQGEVPRQMLTRLVDGKATDFPRLAYFTITASDEGGHYLPDELSTEDLANARTLLVEVGFHGETEDRNFYVNDRYHGLDIDGDPTNGVAKVDGASFRLVPVRP